MTPKTEFDPYSVLGVTRTASAAEIRSAYRALVAKYHPDRHQGNPLEELAAARMAEVNRAYEILGDPTRRSAYDGGPATWARAAAGPAGAGSVPRKHIRWLQLLALLFLFPILIRSGAFIVRLVARLVRAIFEVTKVMRGTPLAGGIVLVVLAILVLVLVRRRLARRKSKNA